MKLCSSCLWTMILCGLVATPARAHFLFIRILPPAEAGRFAEVYFSELAEAGDPRFVEKIAHTQLWLQAKPGVFQPLKVHQGADRLRALLPTAGSLVVVGVCDYGVLARPKQPAFLLRHYPKAMAGNPEELRQMLPRKETPFEIQATVEGDRIRFVALRSGKPVPGAVFHTVDENLGNEELKADAEGRATWKPVAGRYSVYTNQVLKEAGDFRGKHYDEIREFATLAFTWPLERKGADPKAVALFQEALAARVQWKNFPGFRAQVEGALDGRKFDALVTVDASGAVKVETEQEVAEPWLRGQIESIVQHRGAGESTSEQSTPVLRFADDDTDHPLGRLLTFEGGQFASSYRIKDRQIRVVNRNVGKLNMTITVLHNERTPKNLFLPHSYIVQYWDAASGELRRAETVEDHWQQVGAWDLPASHSVTTASASGLSARWFKLSKHQLAGKK